MGDPYLNSGETIILTTDRVMVDEVQYDVILTSQRLVLVDSSHTRDHPQVIPFAAILSVKGGMTPAYEPGITLVLADAGEGAGIREITLIFSQMPYEDRAPERDRWVKTLIEHIVEVRQEALPHGKITPPGEQGVHPSVRRWVAPEMPQPHTDVAQAGKRAPAVISTGTQDAVWDAPVEGQPAGEADEGQVPSGENAPGGGENETESHDTVTPAAPEKKEYPAAIGNVGGSAEMTAGMKPAVEELPEIEAAEKSSTGDGEPERLAARDEKTPAETAPAPAAVPAAERILPAGEGSSMMPAEARSGKTAPLLFLAVGEPALPVTAAVPAAQTDAAPEVPDIRAAGTEILPKLVSGVSSTAPDIQTGVPDHIVFPVLTLPDTNGRPVNGISAEAPKEMIPAAGVQPGSPALQTGLPDAVIFPVITARESETLPEPGTSRSPPPARRPHRDTLMVIAAAAFILIVIAGGAFMGFQYLAEENNGTTGSGPVVSPTLTAVQPGNIPAVVIPTNGVWVRVIYNGTYAGSVGNPGDLKLVSGTGDQLYYIWDSSGLVQATFQKQDQTGETLTVAVYTNGTEVTDRTVRAPRGTIAILVDPKTGKPPYLPVTTPL